MTHRWKITEKYTNMYSNSCTQFMEISSIMEPKSKHSILKTFQS